MSTQADVTARWYEQLRRDLALRSKARDMQGDHGHWGCLEADVLIIACIALNARLIQDIDFLGGMAAEW